MSSTDRAGRALASIAHEAARFIAQEATSDSLITVIRAEPIKRGERVLIFISVFPESKTRAALTFLERHREAFSNHLKSHARLRPLPRVDFMIDNREVTGAPLGEPEKS